MSSFSFNVALALDRLCRITPPCLYGFGAAAVAAKMRLLPEGAGTGTLAAAAALVWAVAVAADMAAQLRRPFPREYADAWLDWKNRAGGRILAGVRREPVRVTPGIALTPLLKSLAPPLAFVCAVLLLPAARAREKTAAESVLSRVAGAEERLAERGDALADPDRDRFARQLAALRELAAANPEAAAEALASFEQRLAGAEARRLERAAGALEAAADWRVGAREADAGAGRVGGGTGRAGGGSEGGAEAADGHFREVMEEVFRSEGGLEAMPEAVQSAWRDAFGEAPSGDAAGEARAGAGSAAPGADGRRERLLAALREWSETLGEEAPSGAGGESAGGGGEENAGSAAARERLLSAGAVLDALAASAEGAGAAAAVFGSGAAGRGGGEAPLLLGAPSRLDGAAVRLRPLPSGRSDGAGGVLFRERVAPDGADPEAFRAPWRSAVDAPAAVRAGQGGEDLGPPRAQAAERYFRALAAEREVRDEALIPGNPASKSP